MKVKTKFASLKYWSFISNKSKLTLEYFGSLQPTTARMKNPGIIADVEVVRKYTVARDAIAFSIV